MFLRKQTDRAGGKTERQQKDDGTTDNITVIIKRIHV